MPVCIGIMLKLSIIGSNPIRHTIIQRKETVNMLLKDILKNKSYPYIEVRILYDLDGKSYDELFGACAYENKKLISLDGDDYLLDDVIEK